MPDGQRSTRRRDRRGDLRNGPLAVQAILKTLNETEGLPEVEALKRELEESASEVFKSEDAKEGPLAFKEKRAPNFKMK